MTRGLASGLCQSGRVSADAARMRIDAKAETEIAMQTGLYAVSSWIDDEGGVTAIEYALLGSLIAVAVVGAVHYVGNALGNLYQYVASQVTAATH